MSKIVGIVGANGLVGTELSAYMEILGYEVRRIVRDVPQGNEKNWWRLSRDSMRGLDVLINVAGAPIDKRWTKSYRMEMWESRVGLTEKLKSWLIDIDEKERCSVWINISAVGVYGDHANNEITERASASNDFLANLCVGWEKATVDTRLKGVRVVLPRIGVVLSRDAKFWKRLKLIFGLGLGGRLASGEQWFPWLAVEDLLDAFALVIEDSSIRGAINVVSWPPVTNAEFTRSLSRVLRKPAVLPVPTLALHLLLGDFAKVTLASQKVIPTRLRSLGFKSRFESLEEYLRHLEAKQ